MAGQVSPVRRRSATAAGHCLAEPGLHAIDEAVDVTDLPGGYNFQWAWASGWAAAQLL
jgi:predicted flavoprotein YhiN